MMITLHKNATTTPAVRAQIQQSSGTDGELAAQFGISRTTVQRWKHRDSVADRSHTPHRLQTTLNGVRGKVQAADGQREACQALLKAPAKKTTT